MKKVMIYPYNIPPNTGAVAQNFFSHRKASVKPSYLLCPEDDENNPLCIFITSNDDCWIKNQDEWKEFIVANVLSERGAGGSHIFSFKTNNFINRLTIPYSDKNIICELKEGTKTLKAIPLSCEELEDRVLPNFNSLDLTGIPETRKRAEQQLELAQEGKEIAKEILEVKELKSQLTRIQKSIEKSKNCKALANCIDINPCEILLEDLDKKQALFKFKLQQEEKGVQSQRAAVHDRNILVDEAGNAADKDVERGADAKNMQQFAIVEYFEPGSTSNPNRVEYVPCSIAGAGQQSRLHGSRVMQANSRGTMAAGMFRNPSGLSEEEKIENVASAIQRMMK